MHKNEFQKEKNGDGSPYENFIGDMGLTKFFFFHASFICRTFITMLLLLNQNNFLILSIVHNALFYMSSINEINDLQDNVVLPNLSIIFLRD